MGFWGLGVKGLGTLLGGPYSEVHSTLGSTLGPLFLETPRIYIDRRHLCVPTKGRHLQPWEDRKIGCRGWVLNAYKGLGRLGLGLRAWTPTYVNEGGPKIFIIQNIATPKVVPNILGNHPEKKNN